MGARLEQGQEAPAFALVDQAGETVSLAGLAGRRVLVYFYPRADTPGCTTQACGLRDVLGDIGDTAVVGISPDTPAKLAKFDTKYSLGFPLLSDPDHAVAEAYGVWVEKSMYGKKYMGMERSTFVIGPDGVITDIFRKVKPAEHDTLVLEAIS